MNKVKVALLGFGTVGVGVWNILKDNAEHIAFQTGKQLEVSKILVLKINDITYQPIDKAILTENFNDILYDDSIEIVIEVTGAIAPAVDFMTAALKAGKHVVTANKHVIARHGEHLFKIAKAHGKSLYFEATVGGGIPVIREMTEGLAANKIEHFAGILNGTTNYILTKMKTEHLSYKVALKEAQALGYAEADPTGDVKGYDAVNKLSILTMLAYNESVHPDDIYCTGIDKINSDDIVLANALGHDIKLLATAKKEKQKLTLGVYPALVNHKHMLSKVNDVFNALLVKGNAVDDILLYGCGAGSLPTGSAIVSDIISIVLQSKTPLDFKLDERYNKQLELGDASKSEGQYFLSCPQKMSKSLIKALNHKDITCIEQHKNEKVAIITSTCAYQTLLNIIEKNNFLIDSILKVEKL